MTGKSQRILVSLAALCCGASALSAQQAQMNELVSVNEDTTLFCRGQYKYTSPEGETFTGSQSFYLTISLTNEKTYMTGWRASGSFSGPMREMNNDVRDLRGFTETEINLGNFRIDRQTGQYSVPLTTEGSCTVSKLIPIPYSEA